MATLWEYIHCHAFCTCLSAQQHANVHGLGQGWNRVLLIFLFTKRQRIRDKMTATREKVLKKSGHSSPEALHHHVHAKSFLLPACTCLRYMVHGPDIRHVPCTMYTTWLLIKLCDKKMNVCLLEYSHVAFLERLYAVHVQPLVPVPVLAYAGKAGPSLMMMVTVCTVAWPYTAPPCPYWGACPLAPPPWVWGLMLAPQPSTAPPWAALWGEPCSAPLCSVLPRGALV